MEYLSLFDLQKKIRDSLIDSFPLPVWVVAEIGEMKLNYAGHCYLELVEKEDSDGVKIRAKVSANIWANKFRLLKTYFETSTRVALEEGLKVLIKVDVRFHEVYGLSLNIVDIDPSYTIGEMKLQRNLVIQRLMDDGIIDLNRELSFPMVPQRIAVISSRGAAGYQDFRNHISDNPFGYTFNLELFVAVMQGNEAEASIVAALDKIYSQLTRFDVVVIIRGGGSQTDLACFDSYEVAANVAQFPLPILSGIGHDKDESVVDIVAHQSFKTPTAVANFLVDKLGEFDGDLDDCVRGIGLMAQRLIQDQKLLALEVEYDLLNRVRSMLNQQEVLLGDLAFAISNQASTVLNRHKRISDEMALSLQSLVSFSLKRNKDRLEQVDRELNLGSKIGLTKLKNALENLEIRINASNPNEILRRGYSLTLCNGFVVRQTEGLVGQVIETVLSTGRIKSEVVEVDSKTEYLWQKRN